jgi:sec-independent protein translocase protein TatA
MEGDNLGGSMIGGIGIPELLIILAIVLVIFGANKLPEIGSGMGRAIKNFKKATNEPEEIDITSEKDNKSESEENKKENDK